MSRLTLALLGAAAVAALAPAAAQAAATPFGHQCTPQEGYRSCPTTTLDQRVPSFDGTPLDVDVTLPPAGDGPFPTLLLLHGLGGTKTSFLTPDADNPGYDAPTFARAGYAVVTPTARGFGNSCGKPESRTQGCENGFTRLGDIRYEVRDLQTLVGILVDQGIARPDAVASTGISYGGGMSTMLAFLKDRIKLPDGTLVPWTSPNGTPIRLTAAWPRWLWTNGESIFLRNGRADAWSRTPTGVPTASYAGGIFLVAFSGFTAPEGGPIDTDVHTWKARLDAGTLGPEVQPTLDNAFTEHGVAALPPANGGPAPLLLQSGWTDALFPVGQSLAAYDRIRAADPLAPVALQFGDLGHAPGANNPTDTAVFNGQGARFLESWLLGTTAKLFPGTASVFLMRCPSGSPAQVEPITADNYKELTTKTVRMRTRRRLRIDSSGNSKALAEELNPLGSRASHCTPRSPDRRNKATIAGRVRRAFTMIGRPVITGRVNARGRYGQIDARLWDFNPRTGEQLLITRGAYRLEDDEKGSFRFTLDGNGWRFAKGRRVVVELTGRDEPTYRRSPATWRATLTKLRVALPAR
ncbi:MAG TPA: CocE/NonD family hydrolase [Solirubrobacteraceae bacterium]